MFEDGGGKMMSGQNDYSFYVYLCATVAASEKEGGGGENHAFKLNWKQQNVHKCEWKWLFVSVWSCDDVVN